MAFGHSGGSGDGHGATSMRALQRDYWACNVRVPAALPFAGDSALVERLVRWMFECLGQELIVAYVARLSEPAFVRDNIREQRQRWWKVRNARLVSREVLASEVVDMLWLDFMMQMAGFDPDALSRMNACMSAGCVCDGCDLWDGQRLSRLCNTQGDDAAGDASPGFPAKPG